MADVPGQEANANSAIVATYNAALLKDFNELQGDGLPVVHVQENAAASGSGGSSATGWLNYTTDFTGGTVQDVACAASKSPPLHPG